MKILQHTNSNLVLKDSAGCFWMLGLFFVIIAGTFVIGLMGAFHNLNELNELERTGVWFISLGGLAAGIWFIYSNPGTRLDFNKTENMLTIQRRGLMRNEIEKHLLNNIEEIILVESEDSEGDPVYRIELQLKNENKTNLTELWINHKEGLQKNIDTINDFLQNKISYQHNHLNNY
ncbi:MAG: hypothetical protein U5J96_04460 [Ignavibacteriaceae bacterium]|nr:hypothetical protein [Ignavibacteriaceae bacterium]